MKDLSRNVTLYCDVCGNDQFSTLDEIACELIDAPDETRMQESLREVSQKIKNFIEPKIYPEINKVVICNR